MSKSPHSFTLKKLKNPYKFNAIMVAIAVFNNIVVVFNALCLSQIQQPLFYDYNNYNTAT